MLNSFYPNSSIHQRHRRSTWMPPPRDPRCNKNPKLHGPIARDYVAFNAKGGADPQNKNTDAAGDLFDF